jgi:hypothetical protein
MVQLPQQTDDAETSANSLLGVAPHARRAACNRWMRLCQLSYSIFNERLESRQRAIPMFGDGVEILLHTFYWLRIELETAFASCADRVHDSCVF